MGKHRKCKTVAFLDLPENIPYNILSRLPIQKIFQFRSVCKTFSKILTDPYFSELHLLQAPKTTSTLIVTKYSSSDVHMYMLDFDQPSPAASSSVNARSTNNQRLGHNVTQNPFSKQRNVKYCSHVCFNATIVGSCNGLLCYYYSASQKSLPFYIISNPVLGEYILLHRVTPCTPDYTYLGHSGFGFCQKTEKYKIICFMSKKSSDSNWTPVAEIYTIGTRACKTIDGVHVPKSDGSFDAYLNGNLHWITGSQTSSDLICSFDLYTDNFKVIPPPDHFKRDFINKMSGIKVGSLNEFLCVTYVSEDVQFTVWVMKEYGVKESWTKHFSIDINYYVGMNVSDFDHLVKFSHNGELWFITRFDTLLCYSPRKKSFKELSILGIKTKTLAIPHVPSLLSMKYSLNLDEMGMTGILSRGRGFFSNSFYSK